MSHARKLEWIYEGECEWSADSVFHDDGRALEYRIRVLDTGLFSIKRSAAELISKVPPEFSTFEAAKDVCQSAEDALAVSVDGYPCIPDPSKELILTRQILKWLVGPNTGLSSQAMALCTLGIERTDNWQGTEHPHDPADFNRCLLLVEDVPEVRGHFGRIAGLSPQWAALIHAWDELQNLFVSEVGWNWSVGRSAPDTYKRMKEIIDCIPAK